MVSEADSILITDKMLAAGVDVFLSSLDDVDRGAIAAREAVMAVLSAVFKTRLRSLCIPG